jgi:septum formation protein
VLACDTEVIVDGEVFGKPPTAEAAYAMLTRLAGQAHEVLGGIVVRRGDDEWEAVASTTVRFRVLDPAELYDYVQTGEWEGRAGGYAIQGKGAALVDRIEGDFWNVVGLPVPELVRLLKNAC